MKTTTTSNRRTAHMLMAALTAFLLLLSIAPGADAKGDDSKRGDTTTLAATGDCADGWVLGPQGCQPGSLTTKDTGDNVQVYLQCPAKFVVASVPGGCLANHYTTHTGDNVYAFVYTCAAEFDCDDFVLAAEAFGGCTRSSGGVSCVIPSGPPDPRP